MTGPRTFVLAAALLALEPAHAATVLADVVGVRNGHGHVLVALCTKATFLRPHCPWRGEAPAAAGTVRVRIENVPAGLYAAQAFHDEDDNGKLERSMLGLPKEAMGFSNDARLRMGPPRFDDAAFTVAPAGTTITFHLRYY